VHPIITHGGSQVNVIPGEVRLETFVRGKSLEAIADADRKVDRALRAGALALGCTVEIETLPGYMPLRCDPLMVERFRAIAADLVGEDNVRTIRHRTGSTDMGDLAQIMPIIHPYVGGATGTPHGADYEIVDPGLTYLTNAKALASIVVDLLADGAAVGRRVVAQAKPPLTRAAYLEFQRRMSRRETYDGGRD
jgi:metal-dependent amidase/aminoacylase/carboxypeptidase family protein